MTELELYKLCCTEDNEYGICLPDELGWINGVEFCVWVPYINLGFFVDSVKKLFGNLFDDGGLAANLRSDCVCINLSDALGDRINLEEMFPKNKYQL